MRKIPVLRLNFASQTWYICIIYSVLPILTWRCGILRFSFYFFIFHHILTLCFTFLNVLYLYYFLNSGPILGYKNTKLFQSFLFLFEKVIKPSFIVCLYCFISINKLIYFLFTSKGQGIIQKTSNKS